MPALIDAASNPLDMAALKRHNAYVICFHAFVEIPRRLIMPSKRKDKILIEVMYKAVSCLPCVYMDEMVRQVLPSYGDRVEACRVDIMKDEGKKRILELSYALFGEDGVHKNLRLAPVPSLWVNEELFFDAIPPRFELEEAIEEVLSDDRNSERVQVSDKRKE